MLTQVIAEKERNDYNSVVSHPLQAYEWGDFREKTGVKVIRRGFYDNNKLTSGFQLTIHKIPHTSFTIGYLPKGDMPDERLLGELRKIGKEEKCIFIQLEPNIIASQISNFKFQISNLGLRLAARPLFTKYNFVLDITKSEEELLSQMHQKARYNIKIAKKYEVEVAEDNSQRAFNEYLKLTEETTKRQGFFAHTLEYHRLMWKTLGIKNQESGKTEKQLFAYLLIAKHKSKILTTWILFVFKDTLYYPYGASSSQDRKTMASSLLMWESIRFGKKLGLKKFDMWGALGPDPDKKDPWYGFHSFKQKFGPEHVEYIGSYDLVLDPVMYQIYKIGDKLRWVYLRLKT